MCIHGRVLFIFIFYQSRSVFVFVDLFFCEGESFLCVEGLVLCPWTWAFVKESLYCVSLN